jgi:alpha-N-acetylglucosaminidase
VLKVGFFRDGEHIPHLPTLPVEGIEIHERPYFPKRAGMPSMYDQYFDLSDWTTTLSYMAKKKFNLTWCVVRPAFTWVAMKETLKQFGVKGTLSDLELWLGVAAEDENALETYETDLARQTLSCADEFGVEVIHEAFGGDVPESFLEEYPDVKHFKQKWVDWATIFIYPDDPMFARFWTEYIKTQERLFGRSHHYYISPYPEVSPGSTDEEKANVQVNFAKGVVKQVRDADPQGTWVVSGWAFTADRNTWSRKAVKRFLEPIPNDMFLVWESWGDKHLLYEWHDYFHGKNWAMGTLHNFGGNTGLYGDMKDVIWRTRRVACDPKAKNAVGFFFTSEGLQDDQFYFDLCTRLAWTPDKVTLEGYLADFVLRRYGEKSAENMNKVLKELVKSVYGTNNYNDG